VTPIAPGTNPTTMLTRLTRRSLFSVFLLPALLVGCDLGEGVGEEPALDRERFVTVYVELRVAALRRDSQGLTDEERDEILRRYDVTEEMLMDFAERHGEEVSYMRDIWDEVESRLDARRDAAQEPGFE